MMPRFFALDRLALHGTLAFVVLAAAPVGWAGSDKDYGTGTPPSTGGGGHSGGSLDDSEVDRAAIIAQCGWTGRLPRGNPFERGGSLSLAWQDSYLDINKFQWSRSFANSDYRNSLCEMFLLQNLRRDNNGLAKFRDRCEAIRETVLEEVAGSGNDSSQVGNFSALDAFFGSSSGGDGGGGEQSCDDVDVMSGNERFACRVLAVRETVDSPNALKGFAKSILKECEKAGADMRRRMSQSQYNSYASSGVHFMGGQCGGGGGGGVVVIQQQNKWYDTLANTTLGLTKVIAPLWVMNDANKRANQTAQMALSYNKELGFPSGSYSGSGIGGMYGSGGGYGYGGGGYGYTGHGGACPYGQCGGNGGIIVGGGGGFYGPGMGGGFGGGGVMGGTCGVPPYAPWSGQFGGCGGGGMIGGGLGGGFGGGMGGGTGGSYAGGNPWLNGGAAGRYPGSVYSGGTPGFYGPGGAGGGWGGNGLGSGVGGMPGPFGSLNGGNGWGGNGANMGQWGPGGLYGQTPFYGSGAGGYDAQQATLMAQQMQQYAQAIQRQADEAAKAQSRYKADLDALYKTYGKSYQSYMAAQTASSGLSGLGSIGGMGMGYGSSGYGAGGSYMGGNTGIYYPPYSSGGSNLSLGVQYNSRR